MGLAFRTYLSSNHLGAARFFSKKANVIEAAITEPVSQTVFDEHVSYVIGSVLCAVAFLEGNINEYLENALESVSSGAHHPPFDQVPLEVRRRLAEICPVIHKKAAAQKVNVDHGKRGDDGEILYKYRMALGAFGKPNLEAEIAAYENARDLVKLRNELTHYRPEWVSMSGTPASIIPSAKRARDLENRLRDKFPMSPLGIGGGAFFPYGCLSHGCSAWAVRAVVDFAGGFHMACGLPRPEY